MAEKKEKKQEEPKFIKITLKGAEIRISEMIIEE